MSANQQTVVDVASVQTESTHSLVSVIRDSQGKIVKLTSMTVLELHAVGMVDVWMEWPLTLVIVIPVSLEQTVKSILTTVLV